MANVSLVTRRAPRGHLLAVVLFAALTSAACDESLTELTGPTPNLDVSFSSIQRDIFDARDSAGRPACTSCHSDAGARFNGGLSLQSNAYTNLVSAAAITRRGAIRVVPGDPDNSYVVQKLEGASGISGARMPLGGPFLTEGQMLVIRRWIAIGAPNN